MPLALYDRLVILAGAASAPIYPGRPVTAKLQPIASDDELDGTVTTRAGKETHLIYDATGSVTPSHESIGGPGDGPPGGGPKNQPRTADAIVHIDAVFRDSSLQHAESTESLAFGNAGMTVQQSWSVVRVP